LLLLFLLSSSKKIRRDGRPLFVERTREDRLTGAAIPIIRIEGVALLAMKIRVDAGAIGSLNILGESVRGGPVAVGIVPQGVKKWRESSGLAGRQFAECLGRRRGHGGL
jgi:hypothetical protein